MEVDYTRDRARQKVYQVSEIPPWYITALGALQQVLANLYGPISVVFIIHGNLCDPDNDILFAELLSSAIFMSGVCTLIQVTFGIRLPIVQNSSHSFIPPVIAMMATPAWTCPVLHNNGIPQVAYRTLANSTDLPPTDGSETWRPRLLEISGSMCATAAFHVFLGCSGSVGFLMNFIGPITIIPTVALIGLSLFETATDGAEHQWGIAIMVIALLVIFSLILAKVSLPFPSYSKKRGWTKVYYPIFRLFPHILAVGISWLLCYVLTITDVFPSDPDALQYKARTDAKGDVIQKAKWWFWPYPGMYGAPTFGAGIFVGLFATTISTIVESVGDYYTTAAICDVPPPPKHAVNRGIAMEGFDTLVGGLIGVGTATTSYSGTVGVIGMTGIRSRIVWQVFGALMVVFGVIGKIGAALSTLPEPIIGGLTAASLGMVISIALSNVRHIDTSSSRNMLILAISIMLGMMVPTWIKSNPGIIQTGNSDADQVVTVLLSTNMFVGGVLACFMDNVVAGSREERGLVSFKAAPIDSSVPDLNTDTIVRQTYDVPFVSDALRRVKCCGYVPFLPSYVERSWCHRHNGRCVCDCAAESDDDTDRNDLSEIYDNSVFVCEKLESGEDIAEQKTANMESTEF